MNARERFGVDPGSSPDEVKAEWRRRAMDLHPDRGGDAEQFAEVRRLYTAAVSEAIHEVSQPPVCGSCNGLGHTTVSRGFSSTRVACPVCKGSGIR